MAYIITMDTTESLPKYQVLVLGVGNILRCDDGIGNMAVGLLRDMKVWPDSVMLVEAGTAIFHYVPEVSCSRSLIIIDAVHAGGKPGSIYRYEKWEDIYLFNEGIESHGLPLVQIIAWARALTGWPADVVVYGVEPANLDFGSRISHPVRSALPSLLSRLTAEINKILGLG